MTEGVKIILIHNMMIKYKHSPPINGVNRCTIVGDDIPELIETCVLHIRLISQQFYKEELQNDLSTKGISLIDCHAGLGTTYIVKLKGGKWENEAMNYLTENGCRKDEIVEFVEYHWNDYVRKEKNLYAYFEWSPKNKT